MNKTFTNKMLNLIVLVLLIGCGYVNYNQYIIKLENKNNEQQFNTFYLFDVVSQYDNSTFYIGKDNRLYEINSEFTENKLFTDNEMRLFSFAGSNLLYIDLNDKLHIVNLVKDIEDIVDWKTGIALRGLKGFRYRNAPDCVIYDDRIIYISSNNTLQCLFIESKEMLEISGEYVYQMAPYENKIFYTIKNNNIFQSNTLKIYELENNNIDTIAKQYMYKFRLQENFIYYIDDYSLYKMDMTTSEKVLIIRDNNLFNFELSEENILCMTKNGLVKSDLDGDNISIIENEECFVISSNYNKFVYIQKEEDYFGIINADSLESIKIKCEETIINCGFLSHYIFIRTGEIIDNRADIHSILFYDYSGNLVYVIE